jgi:hypothetical protein
LELLRSRELQDELLLYWLQRLAVVGAKLHDTNHIGPRIRPKIFQIGSYHWPACDFIEKDGEWIEMNALWNHLGHERRGGLKGLAHTSKFERMAIKNQLQLELRYRPRKVLRVVKTIQRAIDWAEKRLEGHERALDHDARLQLESRAQEILRSEAVVAALSKER